MNGLGSNLNFGLQNSGLFIREVQNLFNVSKDYFMQNIIALLEDFKEPMQASLDRFSESLVR